MTAIKLALALLATSCCLIAVAPALAYQSPGQPVNYVSDYADLLTPQTEDLLNDMLKALEASTSAQIAIVTIPSLEGDTIENYAEKLFQDWGIGQENQDNGLLLLVAKDDRQVRIEVGYGLEPLVTDAKAHQIIQTYLIPAFKQNQYALGITQATDQLVSLIEASDTPQRTVLSKEPFFINWLPYLLFLFPFIQWLLAIMARSKSIWLGGLVGALAGAILSGLYAAIILGIIGLILDALVSRGYSQGKSSGSIPWYAGGNSTWGGSSSSSGGFGGFSGGSSGGGGASGKW